MQHRQKGILSLSQHASGHTRGTADGRNASSPPHHRQRRPNHPGSGPHPTSDTCRGHLVACHAKTDWGCCNITLIPPDASTGDCLSGRGWSWPRRVRACVEQPVSTSCRLHDVLLLLRGHVWGVQEVWGLREVGLRSELSVECLLAPLQPSAQSVLFGSFCRGNQKPHSEHPSILTTHTCGTENLLTTSKFAGEGGDLVKVSIAKVWVNPLVDLPVASTPLPARTRVTFSHPQTANFGHKWRGN